MADITKENVKAYEDVARHICHTPESEPMIIFSIRGQRNEDCTRECEGCPNYPECFPPFPDSFRRQWAGLIGSLLGAKQVEDGESQDSLA